MGAYAEYPETGVPPLTPTEKYALKWLAVCQRYGLDPDMADVYMLPAELESEDGEDRS